MNDRKNKAFTLLELLVAIAIVAILAGIAIPNYFNYTKKAKFSSVLLVADALKIKLISICSTRNLNLAPQQERYYKKRAISMGSVPRAMHVAFEQLVYVKPSDLVGRQGSDYISEGVLVEPIPGCSEDFSNDFKGSSDIESARIHNGVLMIKTTNTFDNVTLIMVPAIRGNRITWTMTGTACEKGYVECDDAVKARAKSKSY